jgi:hypothetical protein
MFAAEEDENLELLTRGGQHQSILRHFIDKLHIFQPVHLHQVGACSGLNPYVGPYHRAPLHRERLVITTPPMITLRSGVAPAGTP